MYEHKTNQTRQQILDAFIELLHEKDISKITINDITKVAHINRGTFYRHFDDKIDLIEKTETVIFEELEAILNNDVLSGKVNSPLDSEFNAYRVKILQILKKHSLFITAMIGENGDLTFENKLMNKIYDFAKAGMYYLGAPIDHPTLEQDLALQFMTNGLLGIFRYWLKRDEIDIEDVSKIIDSIMLKGVLEIIGFRENEK
ncbi:TetR/AcrR family transcriptional regulator [Weissella muntiaci]|uniref:TetR/AcrR family transcriptional regulator n=1 Tax=Weissella muntiaci TaxID=2508881 RepID=A0A6C2C495_9LACO|nr:TetR/AcrR family transcriptional regulator [Weissella muntiaci]TYC48145.1 TetR/AcrR family transcriptional regulator [Weissella muntiaci]